MQIKKVEIIVMEGLLIKLYPEGCKILPDILKIRLQREIY